MPTFILVPIMVLTYTFQNLFCKLYSEKYPGGKSDSSIVFSISYGLVVALISLFLAGFNYSPSPFTLILGIFSSVIIFTYNTCFIRASECGPYSIVMIFALFGGLIIPLFESTIFFDARLSTVQIVGIAVMLAAFVFLNLDGISGEKDGNGERKKEKKPISLKFILICLLLGISNGLYTVMFDIHKEIMNGLEKNEFTVTLFFASAILASCLLIFTKRKKTASALKQTKLSLVFMLMSACAAGFAVVFLVQCIAKLGVSVTVSINNGGVLVISFLASLIFFREKITLSKITGVILSIAAIVMLSI